MCLSSHERDTNLEVLLLVCSSLKVEAGKEPMLAKRWQLPWLLVLFC
jgi:hypothetical protein